MPEAKLKKKLNILICLLLSLPLLGWFFWEDIQNQWNFFLLRSQKAEVGDKARDFLVERNHLNLLKKGLTHSNLQVKRQATFAIHQLWQHPAATATIPLLINLVENRKEDTKVRWHSIRALGYLRATKAVPLLIEVLEEEDVLCPNPECKEFHLWEESHRALEKIMEAQQKFQPNLGTPHRKQITKNWKKLWEKFKKESL